MAETFLALNKDKLLHVLGFIHSDSPIPIERIQQLYDKYGDECFLDSAMQEIKIVAENKYWTHGWLDEKGTFENSFDQYIKMKREKGKI